MRKALLIACVFVVALVIVVAFGPTPESDALPPRCLEVSCGEECYSLDCHDGGDLSSGCTLVSDDGCIGGSTSCCPG